MHLSSILYFITEFGDQAVILPFAITVAITLAAAGARREALIWSAALVVALAGSLFAKIVFIPCGHLLPGLDIRSPSGHTTAAVAAYGGFATLWVKLTRDSWTRAAFIAGALAACFGIAVSRVLLGAHSMQEVSFGAAIGLLAPIILYRVEPPASEPRPQPTLLLLLLPLSLTFLFHGATLPVENRIDWAAKAIMAWLGICG